MFIYQPRAGDRVFVERCGHGVHTVRWPNGCRHVFGGIELQWETATPRRYWRAEAKKLLTAMAEVPAMVAWDAQGTIGCVVPLTHGFWVVSELDSLHQALHGAPAPETRKHHVRLWAADAANRSPISSADGTMCVGIEYYACVVAPADDVLPDVAAVNAASPKWTWNEAAIKPREWSVVVDGGTMLTNREEIRAAYFPSEEEVQSCSA